MKLDFTMILKKQIGWRDEIEKKLIDMHIKQDIWDKMAIKDIRSRKKLTNSR